MLCAIDSELKIVGKLLLDIKSNSHRIKELKETDFYLYELKTIFSAIKDVFNQIKSADIVLVAEFLDRKGLLAKIGGEKFLLELVSNSNIPLEPTNKYEISDEEVQDLKWARKERDKHYKKRTI